MHAFLAGDADVLVSTTIIESGIDIPQANTLVVERADALGLAQLYQIRGRVGRSDVLAYAYLFYPDAIGADARGPRAAVDARRPHGARRRLPDRDARSRDPRRRRSARRRAVGARRRARIRALRRDARRGGRGALRQARAAARPVRVDARVDAYVPASYVAAEALKIDLHRRIALAEDEDELRELRASDEDRYGPIPEPVENLFAIQEAKLKLARLGADYLVFRGGRGTVGPLALGSAELRALRRSRSTVVYTRPSARSRCASRARGGARAGRCYLAARGRLTCSSAPCTHTRTDRNCDERTSSIPRESLSRCALRKNPLHETSARIVSLSSPPSCWSRPPAVVAPTPFRPARSRSWMAPESRRPSSTS